MEATARNAYDVPNPYIDEAMSLGVGDGNAMLLDERWLERSEARERLVRRYAWAIPTAHAISVLVHNSPLVEMGAGTGYWASLVRAAGGDIIAYDSAPPGSGAGNGYHDYVRAPDGTAVIDAEARTWTEVKRGDPAMLSLHPDRALFLCWPPCGDQMGFDSLAMWGGKTLIYVGEGRGGCTGNDEFHETLDALFIEEADFYLPQWPGLHDRMFLYRRRS